MSVISNNSSFDDTKGLGLDVFSRPFIRPNSKYFMSSANQPVPHKHKPSDIINAVYRDRDHSHLRINLDFQQYLFTKDDIQKHTANVYGMGIVSFVGDKGTGKAFLADSIISDDFGKVCRGFSKNQKQIINSSCYQYEGYDGNPLQFFVHRKDTQKDSFIWLYIISSVIVLNVKENDSSQFRHFLKNVKNLKKNLQFNDGEISRPKLIIALKNSQGVSFNQQSFNNFLDQIQQSEMFDRNISTLNFQYPGRKGVKQRQILDVPLVELTSNYLDSVKKLSHMIKSSRPKNIMGNKLTPKFLSYVLDAVTNDLNNKGMTQKVRLESIWNSIVQEYGIGYHNFYLQDFTQKLGKQLQDKKPISEFQMYQLLEAAKRSTQRKAMGFQNLNDDPIFQNYRQKVKDQISKKENEVLEINRNLSERENKLLADSVFSNMNSRNYNKKIDYYNNTSPYEYRKSNTMVDAFDRFVYGDGQQFKIGSKKNDSSMVSSRWRRQSITDSLQGDIQSKEAELKDLQIRLTQSKTYNQTGNESKTKQIALLLADNKRKQQQIKQQELKLSKMKSSTRSYHSNFNQNEDINKLQQQISELKQKIEQKDKQTQQYQNQKNSLVKSRIDQLNQTLRKMNITQQHRTVLRSGLSTKRAETGARDGPCAIM